MLRRARDLSVLHHTSRLSGVFVKEDELIRTLLDVKLLLGSLCYLGAVRLHLLNHGHVEGTQDTACDSASPWPSVQAKEREALLAPKLLSALVGHDPIERPDPPSFAGASAAVGPPPAWIRQAPGSLPEGLGDQEGA